MKFALIAVAIRVVLMVGRPIAAVLPAVDRVRRWAAARW